MARRTVCLVPVLWTKERAESRNCGRAEHAHVTRTRADDLVASGEGEWLIRFSVVRSRIAPRGSRLSIKVGETLALMVYGGSRLASCMVREIRRRPRG